MLWGPLLFLFKGKRESGEICHKNISNFVLWGPLFFLFSCLGTRDPQVPKILEASSLESRDPWNLGTPQSSSWNPPHALKPWASEPLFSSPGTLKPSNLETSSPETLGPLKHWNPSAFKLWTPRPLNVYALKPCKPRAPKRLESTGNSTSNREPRSPKTCHFEPWNL